MLENNGGSELWKVCSGSVRRSLKGALVLAIVLLLTTLPDPSVDAEQGGLKMPWREAGLTERQAAAHLLNRFTFGARPGDIDRVVEMGLERWVEEQLRGDLPDPIVDDKLSGAKSLDLSARKTAELYPNGGRVLRMAIREGAIERPENGDERQLGERDGVQRADRRKARQWARERGFRNRREATYELVGQKLIRGVYSENQLNEVLTDFWFNHFNVSITDNQARIYVWPYERDAIRPHVTGSFRAMLEATAKHPAMLHYLDNVRSAAGDGAETTLDMRRASFDGDRRSKRWERRRQQRNNRSGEDQRRRGRRSEGLNENYARELMELHTLGVDGGYDQNDVVEVARAFTGWSTYPPEGRGGDLGRRIRRAQRYPEAGFVFEDSFIFRADAHDAGPKTVLGHKLPAGRGMEDGLEVLDLLAAHPSTARHLARKFAARFVRDEPPAALVDRLAATYERTNGDLGQWVRTLVESPEFWAPEARHAKIKSPFEVVISALRVVDAEVTDPRGIYDWIRRMGQPLYAYQAPTGFPDRAGAWVSTGALLSRMNFGLQLATGQVPGVRLDLPSLAAGGRPAGGRPAGGRPAEGQQPASLDEALDVYLPLLLVERDVDAAKARLSEVIHDPELAQKIADAAPSGEEDLGFGPDSMDDEWDVMAGPGRGGRGEGRRGRAGRRAPPPAGPVDHSPVAHVAGVILGSPEFQRR